MVVESLIQSHLRDFFSRNQIACNAESKCNLKVLQEVETANEMNCNFKMTSAQLRTLASFGPLHRMYTVQTVKLPRDSTGVRDDGLSITCKYCTNLVIVVKVIEKQ